jgi:hypothetical protein
MERKPKEIISKTKEIRNLWKEIRSISKEFRSQPKVIIKYLNVRSKFQYKYIAEGEPKEVQSH